MGGVAHYHVDKRSFLPGDNIIVAETLNKKEVSI